GRRDEIVAGGVLGQLTPEHRRRPRLVAEQRILQRHDRFDVPPMHLTQDCDRVVDGHAGSTDFGRPGGEASGRRRYIGSSVSDAAPSRTRVATRRATSVADAVTSAVASKAENSCGYNATPAPT